MTRKNGFTLVEIIVTLAILTILMAALTPLFFQPDNTFRWLENQNEEQLICREVFDTVGEHLRFAENISIDKSEPLYENTITVKDGRLYINNEDVFGEEFYNGRQVVLNAYPGKGITITLVVTVKKGDKELYSLDSSIKTVNVKAAAGKIEGGNTNDNPIISYR